MFYSAVPAAWIGAGLTQRPADAAAAYRLTLTQGLAFGLILGAKHVVGRPRPYVTLPLEARSDEYQSPTAVDARLSFPSGHAGLSSALVTSWSLSYPRWYVIAPGALWATGVALSRLHLGVHYPSDVIVGAVVGVGVALLVDQLRALITPPPLRASAGARGAPGIPLVLRLTL
jgi:membrane-associated phospholipid phosphatase